MSEERGNPLLPFELGRGMLSNAMSDSAANWSTKSPTDIMADVEAAIKGMYEPQRPQPQYIIMPVNVFHAVFGYPTVALLLKFRRRRPKRFTRQLARSWRGL